MKRNNKFLLYFGCLLLGVSLLLLVFLQIQTKRAERTNAEIVQTMEAILTDRRDGTIDLTREADMPALELYGEDYIALLEIPSYGLALPVGGTWDKGKVVFHPCRFYGTAYNGTLIIGGFDQPGQFDFFDRIQDGTTIKVTDMTGCTFSYMVESVERSDSAEAKILLDSKADLTLFVRDAQLLEYIMLRCVAK